MGKRKHPLSFVVHTIPTHRSVLGGKKKRVTGGSWGGGMVQKEGQPEGEKRAKLRKKGSGHRQDERNDTTAPMLGRERKKGFIWEEALRENSREEKGVKSGNKGKRDRKEGRVSPSAPGRKSDTFPEFQ